MTLADYYIHLRTNELTRPCSWQPTWKHSMEADPIDLYYLYGGQYLPDGITVVLRDSSVVTKSLEYRKTPWLLI